MSDTLIKVENLGKKFTKNLKRSMFYGAVDVTKGMFGIESTSNKLRKSEFWALKDINFELKRGECLGLIGRNGSGKTTLLRILTGIFPPDQGKITMKGRVGALIAVGAGFHPHMSGTENIYLNGSLLGMKKSDLKKKFDQIVDFAGIGDFIDAPVATYSSGMRVKLGFSIAAHIEPDILFIDEVLAVGDVSFRAKSLNAILKLVKDTAVIFVSHNMPQIARISTKTLILKEGRSHFQGSVSEGITKYFEESETQNFKVVSGNGKASLEFIEIFRNKEKIQYNENLIIIDQEDPIKFNFHYKMDKDINQFICHIAFVDIEQKPIAQCFSINTNSVFTNEGEGKVSLELPYTPLNTGKYGLFVNFWDYPDENNRGEILFHGENVIELLINGGETVGYTPVIIRGNWS
jgi:lipopolysaccharide transport system ATP-binding protein